ncbi:MAG: hypothetical protein ABI446_05905 [Gemmatimonadaceae bacterium]
MIDTKQMIFGNAGTNFRHTIAKQRISHYFDCSNMIGISTADSYDIRIRVISQVVAADGGFSKVRMEVQAKATAADRPGGSVRCSSNGLLESRIAKMLAEAAAKDAK